IRQLPGVDFAEPLWNVPFTFENGPYRRKGGVTGILPNASLTVPRDKWGEPIRVPEVGIVMTRHLAEMLHVSVGDSIDLTPITGDRRRRNVQVAALTDSYLGLTVYARLPYLNRLMGEEFALNQVQIVAHPDTHVRAQMYAALKQIPAVQAITAREEMIDNLMSAILENQMFFIGVLVLFSGVMLFGSLLNSSLVNLAEREREVATMMALGYSRWQVGGLFFRESMVVNLIGTVLGLPAGYGLTWLAVTLYATEVIRLPLVTRPWIWMVTLVLSVLFGVTAHLVVQWRVHKMDCLESLKVKE
ncbi:MAG: ABC transporter permease, partial [Planctomycetales bacterium]|nr:ABC transporter permease [Planctomycetales bacterium]